MSWQAVLSIAVVLGIALYLSFLNQTTIQVTFYKDVTHEVPTVILILGSMFIGALLVFFIELGKTSKESVQRLRDVLQLKREKKLLETYNEGMNYLIGSRTREAMQAFRKILDKEPDHLDALIQLGKLYRDEGNHQGAIQLHLKARAKNGDDLRILYSLEEDYEAADHLSQALAVLEEIKNLDQESVVPLVKARDLWIGASNWEKAIEAQKEIIGRVKDKSKAQAERALLEELEYETGVCLYDTQQYEEASRELRRVVKVNKHFVPAYVYLGDAYLKLGKEGEAVKAWEEGFASTSNKALLKRLESYYLEKEHPAKAIQMYQKALETHPDDPLLSFLLGMLYFRLEMIDEALDEFNKLESTVPEASPVHLFLASIHERRGETDLAFQEYSRAFEREKFSFFGYRCDYCKRVASEWAGTCPACGRRNTYAIYWNTGDVNLVPFSGAPH